MEGTGASEWTVSCVTMSGQTLTFNVHFSISVQDFRRLVSAELQQLVFCVRMMNGSSEIRGGELNKRISGNDVVTLIVEASWLQRVSSRRARPEEGESYAMVAAGYQHTAAVTSRGRVVCWGWDNFGQVTLVPDL